MTTLFLMVLWQSDCYWQYRFQQNTIRNVHLRDTTPLIYMYYGLNSLFKSAQVNGEPVNVKALNIGIIFYIL
jgi:hypothetical protein